MAHRQSATTVALLQLKKTYSVRFGALGVQNDNNQLVGRTIRTIEVANRIRQLRLTLNAADLCSGGPITLQHRRPPAMAWQSCQASGGASRIVAQGGLQLREIRIPAPGNLALRLSGRLGREIQILATKWTGL
jgi:hypothetical protein